MASRKEKEMSNPRGTVIGAQGGLERWSRLGAIPARLVQCGALRAMTGQQGVLAAHSQGDLKGAPPWVSLSLSWS
jgi:hypothetical protein